MNSNMVKPETFGHLHLVYHFTIPLKRYIDLFNPTQDRAGLGWGAKKPPISFSPVTSTNVGISPPKFLTFSFKPFATLV